jgi:hypothetical protein
VSGNDLDRWIEPGWKDWLFAWWEGYNLPELRQAALRARKAETAPKKGPPAKTAPDPMDHARTLETAQLDRNGRPVWSVERVRGAERLWGKDLVGPGDGRWMVELARPFGLSSAKTVLDLSAGLGGRARALVGSYDTWVTGLETSPVLADLAMERSRRAGMAKKAPVALYNPENMEPSGSFDLVFGDRILYLVKDKAAFLDRLQGCTKARGNLVLYDYVNEGQPAHPDEWGRWRREEPGDEVAPWSCHRLKQELVQRNLDVRVTEDVTETHRAEVLDHIRALGRELEAGGGGTDDASRAGLARELALWQSRLKVLGSGLNLFRFVVFKPAG